MLAPLIRDCPRSEDPGLTHKQRGLSRATFGELVLPGNQAAHVQGGHNSGVGCRVD
jgi:hypothetical protein